MRLFVKAVQWQNIFTQIDDTKKLSAGNPAFVHYNRKMQYKGISFPTLILLGRFWKLKFHETTACRDEETEESMQQIFFWGTRTKVSLLVCTCASLPLLGEILRFKENRLSLSKNRLPGPQESSLMYQWVLLMHSQQTDLHETPKLVPNSIQNWSQDQLKGLCMHCQVSPSVTAPSQGSGWEASVLSCLPLPPALLSLPLTFYRYPFYYH